ncbi:nitrate ABC transporter permease [Leptolyngbya sp. FACHB-36]|uniref:nitrate ABC transporter permease n=1 Tax=Leptolyngbya sp. FACHB-36 TaxID=2692808 RepID=UPI00322024B6
MEKFSKVAKTLIPAAICIGIVLLVWQLLCMGPESKMPGPVKVIEQTWLYILNPFFDDGGTSKGLGWQIFISLQRVALGYSLAAIVGIAIGIIVGTSTFMRNGLDPLIQVLRTIPPLAWLPISLGIFQDNNPAAIFVIFITAIWPILINTAVGAQQIPQDYNNVAKVLRLSRQEYLKSILIPSTVPYIFTGLRIGIGLAWLAIVAAEMLKAEGGIGFFIWDAYNSGNEESMSQIVIAVLYVGIVGLILDRFVGWLGSLIVSER